jgi:hypothetical protein
MPWPIGFVLAALACSSSGQRPAPSAWIATGDHAAFPSPLTVDKATAVTIDATYLYWITTDGFLYRAPRSGGEVDRVALPAPGTRVWAHDDVFVGWTDGSGNAAIAEIDPATGVVTVVNHKPGALLALIAGRHGYSFAVATPDGIEVQTCLDSGCAAVQDIKSALKSLALDLTTNTYYVLTVDGLRTCTVDGGCPAQAAATPAAAMLVTALPGTYYLVDSNGQASGPGGSPNLGSPAAPSPTTKFNVDDGNGPNALVGTWSNGAELAQCVLAPGTTTTQIAAACTDFETDATGRPIYCLVGSSTIQVIP